MYHRFLILLISVLLASPGVSAQPLPSYAEGVPAREYEVFLRAQELNDNSLHESARVLLTELHGLLSARQALYTPFGLRVRLQLAYSWERNEQFPEAAAELLSVIGEARSLGEWQTEASARLLMALIYEQEDAPQLCLNYLTSAEKLIREHDLWELNALLAIRFASYHRFFDSMEQAEYFARLALNEATNHKQIAHQATANLLLSVIFKATDPARSQLHLEQAAALYRESDSEITSIIVSLNRCNLQLAQGSLLAALRHNDAALAILHRTRGDSSTLVEYAGSAYLQRAKILQQLGRLDSAFVYLDRARLAENEHQSNLARSRVSEIEARYRDEQQEQRIQEQAQLLQFRQKRETWMLWFILMAITSLALMAFSHFRLHRAKRDVSTQRDVIAGKNEELAGALREQQLLRGELHHRVKNNLQIIIGLLDLQIGETDEPNLRAGLESTAGRVYSIAAIHEILYREDRVGAINFYRYVEKLTDHFCSLSYANTNCTFELNIPESDFCLETAIPLGTILNELLTNSFKYGLRHAELLRICISLSVEGEEFVLQYCDNGPGFPEGELKSRGGGIGSYLLRGMVRQLGGSFRTFNRKGACCEIRFCPQAMVRETEPGPYQVAEAMQ
ncbi:sensor histidine kinase [Lewinella sp. IMCC34183]|uniref:sensor histidine kinase n=1 Tax=Lewinella sp. IMCC34183 TaxID=2248762 RepID=UPI0013005D69|nr:sensor histidine kinase [Lewinella sp. IMCC34183]